MEPILSRPWYKKKRYLIPIGIAVVFALGSGGSTPTSQQASPQTAAVTNALAPQTPTQIAPETRAIAPVVAPATNLSNDNYYTNVDGNEVHSPAYSNSAPAGASAQCRDGTYSFSQHRSGTCSHHGGVDEWL